MDYNALIILGPTASGKTLLAVKSAHELNGAVLSFDSRQVFRQLNIGAGKDLNAYFIKGKSVPHFLLDICDVNEPFNSYDFVTNFITAFDQCLKQHKLPILCGGTGLYFDLVLKKHEYINIPSNLKLREELKSLNKNELIERLNSFDPALREHADISTLKRMNRAVEVAQYLSKNTLIPIPYPELKPILFGIHLERNILRERIIQRIEQRLQQGMIEEVENLLKEGVSAGRLVHFGLEYKIITNYLKGDYSFETMRMKLENGIMQYSKRQLTWFRKMEREGYKINWIDGMLSEDEQFEALQIKIKLYKALN